MNKISICNYKSPFGELLLGSFKEELCFCDWKYRKMREQIDRRILSNLNASFDEGKSEVIQITIQQLDEYFSKKRKTFNLPLRLVGTEFQQKVWQALQQIPYGETNSYLELSKKLGDPKAIRAVATANGANALAVIVPCHRIIGSTGELVGYAGGLQVKKKLLDLEGSISNQTRLFD